MANDYLMNKHKLTLSLTLKDSSCKCKIYRKYDSQFLILNSFEPIGKELTLTFGSLTCATRSLTRRD